MNATIKFFLKLCITYNHCKVTLMNTLPWITPLVTLKNIPKHSVLAGISGYFLYYKLLLAILGIIHLVKLNRFSQVTQLWPGERIASLSLVDFFDCVLWGTDILKLSSPWISDISEI